MQEVEIYAIPPDRFEAVLEPDRYQRFCEGLTRAQACFGGRTLWSVNSTAKGGGVAEMLQSLLGYLRGSDIDSRWLVIEGDEDFFDLTKRIHNHLHGEPGDGGPLGSKELEAYERCLRRNEEELVNRVGSTDLVIVHDPQPAGLIPALKKTGATVIWRCHIGVDEPNDTVREAWDFLRPYVSQADASVFSRSAYVWDGLDDDRSAVIAPSIDAFSPKNQTMDESTTSAILAAAGILHDSANGTPTFVRLDGSEATVSRQATMTEEQPLDGARPIVLQVSRWDRLKDPIGVLNGFAHHVDEELGAQLVLAGPSTSGVADDPESEEVFREVTEAASALPDGVRERIHLAALPMEDEEENGAIVNALQRRADVVVQKSLQEGFGLTVAEAMWKGRPTVASRVGGIQDQIEHEVSGLLVDDAEDLAAFGKAVTQVLEDRDLAERLGRAAHERVRDEFLPPRHLLQYTSLARRLVE